VRALLFLSSKLSEKTHVVGPHPLRDENTAGAVKLCGPKIQAANAQSRPPIVVRFFILVSSDGVHMGLGRCRPAIHC
jgi:hypothetical protein